MFRVNTYNSTDMMADSITVLFFDESMHCISDGAFCDTPEVEQLASHLQVLSNGKTFPPTLLPDSKDSCYYLCIQIEKLDDLNPHKLQGIGAKIGKTVSKTSLKNLTFIWPNTQEPSKLDITCCGQIFKGLQLSDYTFDACVTKKKDEERSPFNIHHKTSMPNELEHKFSYIAALVDGEHLCKDLMHEPPNRLNPSEFSKRIQALSSLGLSIDILDEERLRQENMHALLAVGQGSKQESRLACIKWHGKSADLKDPICFVGKGVCYDSGGINIKLSSLVEMKYDMGGAACVVGAMKSIAQLNLPINVVGVVALTENMPGGNAYRPSDIISSRSGMQIEVLNTDAEGRLILADALDYAADVYKPKAMLDLATLTGAIIVGLGHEYAGLYSNNDELLSKLQTAGRNSGSKLWHMPLDPAYDKLMDSPIADVQNLSARPGAGSITAAQFLQRFSKNVPWAHIDIAGTAWINSPNDVHAKGPTAYGVSLLTELAAAHAE